MKVIYIAGPFRASNKVTGKSDAWGVQRNVMAAMACALEVWKLGAVALCPHSNTMFFQDAAGCEDSVWLQGDLELLRRCDAIMLTPDWERSSGARAERDFARKLNMVEIYNVEQLTAYLS